MYFAIARPAVEPIGPIAVSVSGSPAIANLTPRALHARLLTNAAMRRRRGMQRRAEARPDDAAYWLDAAFAALSKAASMRPVAAPLP